MQTHRALASPLRTLSDTAIDAQIYAATTAAPAGPVAWSDFHLVLAVHRESSMAKACVVLGMTHATLLRKLDVLESRLKTRLFQRVRGHYVLTTAGEEIAGAAQMFEPIALAAAARARGQDQQHAGAVCLSVAAILMGHVLPPVLRSFAHAFPDVQLKLVTTDGHDPFDQREADIAVCMAHHVPERLVGRKLATMQFKVYGHRRHRINQPMQSIQSLLGARRWIGFEQDAPGQQIQGGISSAPPNANVLLRVDSFSHALTMVRAGLGIALLPVIVEANTAEIEPLTATIPSSDIGLWLLTHPDLRNTARIQAVMRSFGPALTHAVQQAQGSAAPERITS